MHISSFMYTQEYAAARALLLEYFRFADYVQEAVLESPKFNQGKVAVGAVVGMYLYMKTVMHVYILHTKHIITFAQRALRRLCSFRMQWHPRTTPASLTSSLSPSLQIKAFMIFYPQKLKSRYVNICVCINVCMYVYLCFFILLYVTFVYDFLLLASIHSCR